MIYFTYKKFTPKIIYRQGQFYFATVTKMLINYTDSDIIFPQKSQFIQCYLVLSVIQNRDLLKVNPQDGRRGMLKGIHTQ